MTPLAQIQREMTEVFAQATLGIWILGEGLSSAKNHPLGHVI